MTNTICLVTGSTLGGAEYVADHLKDVLEGQDFKVVLFNQAKLTEIRDHATLLVVTSTHGAGELPENLQPLFAEIAQQQPDLRTMQFGVVGLGSSDYDTFCHAVNLVEQALSAQGATQVCPSLRIDVTQEFDHDGCAEAWLPNFIRKIKERG